MVKMGEIYGRKSSNQMSESCQKGLKCVKDWSKSILLHVWVGGGGMVFNFAVCWAVWYLRLTGVGVMTVITDRAFLLDHTATPSTVTEEFKQTREHSLSASLLTRSTALWESSTSLGGSCCWWQGDAWPTAPSTSTPRRCLACWERWPRASATGSSQWYDAVRFGLW